MHIKALKINSIFLAALVVLGSGTGCASLENQKEKLGTVVGGTIGGALGSLVDDEDVRKWTTVIGTIVGSIIGREIGQYLDEQDRKRLAESTTVALTTGEVQSWHNPSTGTRARVAVTSSETRRETVEMKVLKDRIQETPPLEMVGAYYQARQNTNVRGGPGTNFVRVGSLSSGQTVEVVGKVRGKSWYMISEGGVGTGFVASRLLRPTEEMVTERTVSLPAGQITSSNVDAELVCRTVEQTVQLEDGTTREDTVKACQQSDGSWRVS